MLVGHSTGLDKAYYKPQDEEIFLEFLKSVNLLSISPEYRLKIQLDYYKQREDKLVKMGLEIQERDEGIKKLKEQHQNDIKLLENKTEIKFQEL